MTPDDADDYDPRPRRDRGPGLVPLAVAAVAAAGLGGYAWVQVQRQDRARAEERLARAEAEEAAERAARRPVALGDVVGGAAGLLAAGAPADPGPALARLGKDLVGVWVGGGREVEYRADGTYRDGEWSGTWAPAGLTGAKVLTVTRTGGGPARVRVTFEGDELLHDGPEPGVVTALRRK